MSSATPDFERASRIFTSEIGVDIDARKVRELWISCFVQRHDNEEVNKEITGKELVVQRNPAEISDLTENQEVTNQQAIHVSRSDHRDETDPIENFMPLGVVDVLNEDEEQDIVDNQENDDDATQAIVSEIELGRQTIRDLMEQSQQQKGCQGSQGERARVENKERRIIPHEESSVTNVSRNGNIVDQVARESSITAPSEKRVEKTQSTITAPSEQGVNKTQSIITPPSEKRVDKTQSSITAPSEKRVEKTQSTITAPSQKNMDKNQMLGGSNNKTSQKKGIIGQSGSSNKDEDGTINEEDLVTQQCEILSDKERTTATVISSPKVQPPGKKFCMKPILFLIMTQKRV